MMVDLKDGCCRTCGSALQITDADDATMTVECIECGDSYAVETDAFGDGGVVVRQPRDANMCRRIAEGFWPVVVKLRGIKR